MLADTPFETESAKKGKSRSTRRVLTGNVRGRSKLGGHLGVHRDHHLLFGAHDCVALLDLVGDPGLELVAEHDRANIHDPLLGHLLKIDVVRQEVGDVGLLRHELEDALDGEVSVLRDVQGLHLVVGDVCLLTSQDVLEEVNGRVVCTKDTIRRRRPCDLPYGGR